MSDMPQLQEHVNAASTAMLVMDYQNGVLASVDGAEELLARAADALDAVRKAGVTVGYVRVALTSEGLAAVPATNKTFARLASGGLSVDADSPATAVPDDLAPRAGDIVVRKTRVGAFSTTNLHEQLQVRGIDTLILTGIATSGVVLSTVRDAADRDYRLLLVHDLCADRDSAVHEMLVTKVFPRQADVVSAEDLPDLIAR
jgi:nicotinamidase-related amidase